MAKVNILLAVSVGILSLAFIFIVIGAATDQWIIHGSFYSGSSRGYSLSNIWTGYSYSSNKGNTYSHLGVSSLLPIESYFSEMQKAAGALLIVALIGSILSLCMMGLCLIQDLLGKQLEQTAVFPTLSAVAGGLGAACGSCACTLFAVDTAGAHYFNHASFGYSFGLTIAGCILLTTGVAIGKKAKQNNTQVNTQVSTQASNMQAQPVVVMP